MAIAYLKSGKECIPVLARITVVGDDDSDHGLSMVHGGFYSGNPEENLSPLARLQKHWDSDNVFNRQMVARNLLETLRVVCENPEELQAGLNALVRLSEDTEPMVRSELMEQLPQVAMLCMERIQCFPNTIQDTILPTVVRYLTDSNNQVRKTSQAALLILLEQDLIHRNDMEDQVCPVIIQLSSQDSSDDYRTEAVALMSKVAPLVGHEITERFFLPHFTALCRDGHFHIRKVCAANIGEICNVVGEDATETLLLPRFEALCEDGVWGVRKACAECFMSVSWGVSNYVRRERLSPLFVQLLCDQSRWVRMAAFQNLGPFISTFADPNVTGIQLIYNVDGTVQIGAVHESSTDLSDELRTHENSIQSFQSSLSGTDHFEIQHETSHGDSISGAAPSIVLPSAPSEEQTTDSQAHKFYSGVGSVEFIPGGHQPAPSPSQEPVPDESPPGTPSPNSTPSDKPSPKEGGGEDDNSEYNSFLYWRNPLPVVEITSDDAGDDDSPDSKSVDTNKEVEETLELAEKIKNLSLDDPQNSPPKLKDIEKLKDTQEVKNVQEHKNIQECKDTQELEKCEDNDTVVEQLGESSFQSSAQFSIRHPPEPAPSSSDEEDEVSNPDSGISSPIASPEPVIRHFEPVSESSGEGSSSQSQGNEDNSGGEVIAENPSIPSDADQEVSQLNSGDSSESLEETSQDPPSVNVHRAEENEAIFHSETVSNIGTTHVIGASLADKDNELPLWPNNERDEEIRTPTPKLQDAIPSELLEQYLSMTDPSRAQTVDTEIAKHCAFSLPGVALTLGRKNWTCLKEVYDTLASDMQWKVRRTLAFSIHEMAQILGDEITALDLVPIFNGFLKDLDEVRIGVLKHFADFVRLLQPQMRQQYLKRMRDFLTTDNQRNWRFRLELAEQLILMCDFYSPKEVYDNIFHIAITLACDRVSDVRFTAYRLLSCIIKIIGTSSDQALFQEVVKDLQKKFATSERWQERQAYAHICQKLIEEQAVDAEQFAADFLPTLLDLAADIIPNIRITQARTLSQHVMPIVYFTTDDNPHRERLLEVMTKLSQDEDGDVGFYSSLAPIGEMHIPDDIGWDLPV